jgi:hypothetical protein
MIVVGDTSPLNYLIRIGAVDVLKPLYSPVLIPQTVADELKREKAPAVVQLWIAHHPEWLRCVRTLLLIPPYNSSIQAKPLRCHSQSQWKPTKFSLMIGPEGQKPSVATYM